MREIVLVAAGLIIGGFFGVTTMSIVSATAESIGRLFRKDTRSRYDLNPSERIIPRKQSSVG